MRFALLVHPNTVPEVLRGEAWHLDAVAEALTADVGTLEHFPVRKDKLLWQSNNLDVDQPVNEAAEALVGEANYLHLRGPALVTHAKISRGLSRADLAELTARIIAYKERQRG